MWKQLPTTPQTYNASFVITPDGGLVYANPRTINHIQPLQNKKTPPEVQVLISRQPIRELICDPFWYKKTDTKLGVCKPKQGKFIAIVCEDRSVQIWDLERGHAVYGHKAHDYTTRQQQGGYVHLHSPSENRVLISYMSNRNLLSIDINDIVIYCITSNTYTRRPMFATGRNQYFTALSCSPYNEALFAVGNNHGSIIIGDLQTGNKNYTFKGYKLPVTRLAWTRMLTEPNNSNNKRNASPQGVKPAKEPQNKATELAALLKSAEQEDELFDIYNYEYLNNEFGVSSSKNEGTDNFVGIENPATSKKNEINYLEACESVKGELIAYQNELGMEAGEKAKQLAAYASNEVTLEDCKQANIDNAIYEGNSLNCSSNKSGKYNSDAEADNDDSNEDSLELLQYNSSSDDAAVVDGDERKPKHEVLHHIYHQAEVHQQPAAAAAVTAETRMSAPPLTSSEHKLKKQPRIETDSLTDKLEKLNVKANDSNMKEKYDILLVSLDAAGNIGLWNTLTDVAYQPIMVSQSRRNYNLYNKRATLCCHSKNDDITVYTINNKFNLITYKLQRCGSGYKLIEGTFKAHSVMKIGGFYDIAFDEQTEHMWCALRTRQIVRYDLPRDKILTAYHCVTSTVNTIKPNPHDMNKIAMALYDKRVAILDISKLTPSCVLIECSYNIDSLVMSFDFNPDGTLMYYGTTDGYVGVINLEAQKRCCTFNRVFTREIYSLTYHDEYIYFICNSRVGVYDTNNMREDAVILENLTDVTHMTLRGKYLIVGTRDGKLQVLSRNVDVTKFKYDFVQQNVLMPRMITSLSWCPLAENRLAVGGIDQCIYIFNFDMVKGALPIHQCLDVPGKRSGVVSIAWSYSNENLLVAATNNGLVALWNIKLDKVPILFKKFACPMTEAIFLPTDENILMCAGQACSVVFLNIKEEMQNPDKTLTDIKIREVTWATKVVGRTDTQPNVVLLSTIKPRIKVVKQQQQWQQQEDVEQGDNEVAPEPELAAGSVELAGHMEIDEDEDDDIVPQNHNSAGNSRKKKKKNATSKLSQNLHAQRSASFMIHPETLLFLACKELNKYALEKLHILLTADASKIQETVLCSKLFGTNAAAKELLNLELENHRHGETKSIAQISMTQIGVTLKEEIVKHMENKTLTEWHVSLAPTIDYKFWQECCLAFATQLINEDYVIQGVTYMMAVQKKYEAIKLLMEKNYFKEALLFARVYLLATDPLIGTIINEWIKYLESTGNLPAATMLCVLSNDHLRAYQMLNKIQNPTREMENILQLIKKNGDLHFLLDKSDMTPTAKSSAVGGSKDATAIDETLDIISSNESIDDIPTTTTTATTTTTENSATLESESVM